MKRWVRIVLIVVLAAGLVVGLFGMLRRQTEDRKGAESYAEAAAIAGAELPAAEPAAQTHAEEQETQDPYLQMFARMDVEALRQVNPEVLGWLWLPNTQISYPLMQGTDNEYYLHNTWKNEPNELGAIFLDHRSAPDFSDFNTLIYGHRMQSDAMFATLRFYAEQAHWESAPLVYVRAGDTVYTFTIFAAYEAPVTQPLYLPALTDAAQIDAVFDDIRPNAVKIGMVSSAEIIDVIADRLSAWNATNVVVDPVMVATSGARLIAEDAAEALTRRLFPLAYSGRARHHAQYSRGHGPARLRGRLRAHTAKCCHAPHPPLWLRIPR